MNKKMMLILMILVFGQAWGAVEAPDENIVYELFDAINQGDATRVNNLISSKQNLLAAIYRGHTPLTYAVKCGDVPIVNLLLEKGADVYAVVGVQSWYDSGLTALHIAAKFLKEDFESAALDMVTLLLKKNVPVDILVERGSEKGLTPLHLACWQGYGSVAKKLLENKADANKLVENSEMWFDGFTPLVFVIHETIRHYCHSESLIQLLLDHGAAQDIKFNFDGVEYTPLTYLINNMKSSEIKKRVIQILLNKRLGINAYWQFGLWERRNSLIPEWLKFFSLVLCDIESKKEDFFEGEGEFHGKTALQIAEHFKLNDVIDVLKNGLPRENVEQKTDEDVAQSGRPEASVSPTQQEAQPSAGESSEQSLQKFVDEYNEAYLNYKTARFNNDKREEGKALKLLKKAYEGSKILVYSILDQGSILSNIKTMRILWQNQFKNNKRMLLSILTAYRRDQVKSGMSKIWGYTKRGAGAVKRGAGAAWGRVRNFGRALESESVAG